MDAEERRYRIEDANRRMMIAMFEASDLIMNCPHEKIVDRLGRASCVACKKNLGVYCEHSPTMKCEYEDGKCLFCGRKE